MVAVPNCGDMRSPCSPEGRGHRRTVVSHRLPLRAVPNPDAPFGFDFYLDRAALAFKHSSCLPGDVVYVGALPSAAASIPASEELAAHLLERFSCIPVFLEEDLHKDYYHGFCMNYLWPLFHGVCGADFNAEQYGAYISANTRFAERVLELLVSPDEDLVYIHDYHLLTLPSIIRKQSPSARIYFTLHSAFPSEDVFFSSPIARDLLRNILNADLLAFASSCTSSCRNPIRHDNRAFLLSCSRLLNLSCQFRQGYSIVKYLGRTVVVKSISTSSGKVCHLREMLSMPETAAKVREISTKYMFRKVLLDVDDDDWGRRNNKLRATEKLLESQIELRGQLVHVMINNTRRQVSAMELEIRDRINSRFGFLGYEPVVVIDDPSIHELLALYTLADIFIANTCSTDKFMYYTLCQQESRVAHRPASPLPPRNGTIIETSLPWLSPCLKRPWGAIQVNLLTVFGSDMADGISSVLRMNEEEKQLLQENNYRYVLSEDDPDYWIRSFEQDLETARRDHESAKRIFLSWSFADEQTRTISLDYTIYDAMVSPQELNKLVTTLEMIPREKKKVSNFVGFFSRQGPKKAITLEVIQFLKAKWSDPINTTPSVSGRRKDKSAIWHALHKLMSAHHGDFITSPQSKKATLFSVRIPSYLIAQLVAACNSSASTGQSGMVSLRHPSWPPLIRFLLDSGASMHVVGDARLLQRLRHLPRAAARFATLPDGSRLPIIGIGTIQMDGFSIPNVYLVNGVTVNLVSVSRLATEHDICCCFYRNRCQLMLLADGQTRVVGEAVLEEDGVYGLRFLRVPEATA